MAIEKVRAYFETLGIAGRIQEFEVSSATVELAAQALGCAPAPTCTPSTSFTSELATAITPDQAACAAASTSAA